MLPVIKAAERVAGLGHMLQFGKHKGDRDLIACRTAGTEQRAGDDQRDFAACARHQRVAEGAGQRRNRLTLAATFKSTENSGKSLSTARKTSCVSEISV